MKTTTRNDFIKLTSLAALIAAVPALAFAQLSIGDQLGAEAAEITAALEAQGAQVLEVEAEDGVIEVEYILEGVEYEAEIDPASGQVIAMEIEEADEDDDDDDDDAEDDSNEG